LHPSGVAKSSTSFGWGKGWSVTSAGWRVTLCDPIWHVSSSSGVACCKLLYPVTLLLLLHGSSVPCCRCLLSQNYVRVGRWFVQPHWDVPEQSSRRYCRLQSLITSNSCILGADLLLVNGFVHVVLPGLCLPLLSARPTIKAKFHYASWFDTGRRQVRSQIQLCYLVRTEPASNQL